MRFLIVLAAVACLVAGETNLENPAECHKDLERFCDGTVFQIADSTDCDSNVCGFHIVEPEMRKYVQQHVDASFNYLMLTSYYGNYVKNRPGFHKQFKELGDKAWSNAIDLIKFITKRGGYMVFESGKNGKNNSKSSTDLDEIHALGYALDTEKTLTVGANHLHEKVSHAAHPKHYDADVAHYIEEEFLEYQTKKIRQLSGWTNDVKNLLTNQNDPSLSLFLFDEYLQKQ